MCAYYNTLTLVSQCIISANDCVYFGAIYYHIVDGRYKLLSIQCDPWLEYFVLLFYNFATTLCWRVADIITN